VVDAIIVTQIERVGRKCGHKELDKHPLALVIVTKAVQHVLPA
jgi:hypothetical protein